jgi:hypothetical protein
MAVVNESLSFKIDVLLPVVEISFVVFEFFLEIWLEGVFKVLLEYLLVQAKGVFDICDIFEVNGVRDFEALHSIGMSPLLEVLFECTLAPVAGTSTDLALELNAEPMQFVKPVRYRPSIPTHRKVLWILLRSLIFIVRVDISKLLLSICHHFIVSF